MKETTGGIDTNYLHGIGIDEPVMMDRAGAKYYYFRAPDRMFSSKLYVLKITCSFPGLFRLSIARPGYMLLPKCGSRKKVCYRSGSGIIDIIVFHSMRNRSAKSGLLALSRPMAITRFE